MPIENEFQYHQIEVKVNVHAFVFCFMGLRYFCGVVLRLVGHFSKMLFIKAKQVQLPRSIPLKLLTLSIVIEWLKALSQLESKNLQWLLVSNTPKEGLEEEEGASEWGLSAKKPEKLLRELVIEVAELRQVSTQPVVAKQAPVSRIEVELRL
jgi:hypothetical protein